MEIIELLTKEYEKSYQHKGQWTTALNAYKALTPSQRKLAAEGIFRHVRASKNCDVHFDYSAIGEIWKESDAAFLKEIAVEDEKEFQARLKLPSFAQTA